MGPARTVPPPGAQGQLCERAGHTSPLGPRMLRRHMKIQNSMQTHAARRGRCNPRSLFPLRQ